MSDSCHCLFRQIGAAAAAAAVAAALVCLPFDDDGD
jgi:hypothetical protein